MNQTLVAIVVGLIAAGGGVLLMDSLRETDSASGVAAVDLGPLEDRLLAIERRLPADGTRGVQLSTSGVHPELHKRFLAIEEAIASLKASGGAGDSAGSGGTLERIEERLASIEDKVDGGSGTPAKPKRPTKKRVSLAEAADELELTPQQEDALRDIYEKYNHDLYKLAAGPDGDPEDVKRDIAAASKDPTKAMGIMTKYLPRVMKDIGSFMKAQGDRSSAIVKAIGPEKSTRLSREYDVKEGNALGAFGGMRSGMGFGRR